LPGFAPGLSWNAHECLIRAACLLDSGRRAAGERQGIGKLALVHKLLTGAPGVSAARAGTLISAAISAKENCVSAANFILTQTAFFTCCFIAVRNHEGRLGKW
jgi:hypothetical protein